MVDSGATEKRVSADLGGSDNVRWIHDPSSLLDLRCPRVAGRTGNRTPDRSWERPFHNGKSSLLLSSANIGNDRLVPSLRLLLESLRDRSLEAKTKGAFQRLELVN